MRILPTVCLLLIATAAPSLAQVAKTGRANVRDYGALCNGTYDDTSAFQQAIAAAPIGGIVFVPPGHCVVSQTLVISSSHSVSLAGDGVGSQIFQNNSAATLLQFTGVTAISIRDLFLGSAATLFGTALIELDNSYRNRIDNVTMLGGYYGLHLKGSLLNTMVDLRSGTNFSSLFFAAVPTNQYWVYAEPLNGISANANTFIAPVLEGGTNGIVLTDGTGQGSLQITGGTIEGVTGTGLQFLGTFLPSSVTGIDFEANGLDIIINNSSNIRLSAVNSVSGGSPSAQLPNIVSVINGSRNVQISDSTIDSLTVDSTTKRIVLQNITFGLENGAYSSINLPPVVNQTGPVGPIANITADNVGDYAGGQ
jgi:Pectate lyase superfamily protein